MQGAGVGNLMEKSGKAGRRKKQKPQGWGWRRGRREQTEEGEPARDPCCWKQMIAKRSQHVANTEYYLPGSVGEEFRSRCLGCSWHGVSPEGAGKVSAGPNLSEGLTPAGGPPSKVARSCATRTLLAGHLHSSAWGAWVSP